MSLVELAALGVRTVWGRAVQWSVGSHG